MTLDETIEAIFYILILFYLAYMAARHEALYRVIVIFLLEVILISVFDHDRTLNKLMEEDK